MAYCDYNATAPLRPKAREAVERALSVTGNPSSVHAHGRAAHALMDEAAAEVGRLAGADPDSVVFLSGATEANGLALWGAVEGAAETGCPITRLILSAIEHKSVLKNAQSLAAWLGVVLEILPVSREGVVETEDLSSALERNQGRALVAVMAANNETGVIQPIAEVSRLAHAKGALLLVDAVTAAGKIPLDAGLCDYMTLSGHKLGGPQGAGALVTGPDAPLAAQLLGGGQQRGLRAGTENLSGIAGFGAAASAAMMEQDQERAQVTALRDGFEARLKAALPEATILGQEAPRLGNTSALALKGFSSENLLIALDLDGVMVSSGSACSGGLVAASHVLAAMGVKDGHAFIRVSLGWNSTAADVDRLMASLTKFRARRRAAA